MEILKLTDIIGQEIVELKFHYFPENEYGLQSFHSYIKLANDRIIGIPNFDDEEYLELNQDNLNYYKTMFDTGQSLNHKTTRQLIIGQKIVDFYFCYYENEIDFNFSAFIKLSNSYYLSEYNFGPIGITDVDLIIFDEKQFINEIERVNNINIDIRSFSKTNNIC
jgi:hypothetical protein